MRRGRVGIAPNQVGLNTLRIPTTRHERRRGVRARQQWNVAVLTLAALAAAPSAAAGLDSPCCGDLEQRIEELEATVARKGNRSVKLEVSGLVNTGVMAWDDGGESNVYAVTNDNERSRFRFVGTAAINALWEAGYRIELGLRSANSKLVNQIDHGSDDRPPAGVDLRDSIWFLRNKRLGTMFLGTSFAATDRIANSNVTQTGVFAQYAAPEDTGLGMFLRSAIDGRLTDSLLDWRRIIGAGGDQPGESERGFQLIKYVSPTWHGFTAVGTWVVTDFWDAALRYRGQVGGFDIAAGIGYLQLTPGSRSRSVCAAADLTVHGDATTCRQVSGSASVMHVDTGLFVNFGAGLTHDGLVDDTRRYDHTGIDPDQIFWSGQVGIERPFLALGKSTIYGEFFTYEGGASTARIVGAGDALNPTGLGNWAVWHSNVDIIGGGLAQGIDSAAMILYMSYRHVMGDLALRELNGRAAGGPIAAAPIDDLDLLLAGGIIRF
jgi:hypothetical protein